MAGWRLLRHCLALSEEPVAHNNLCSNSSVLSDFRRWLGIACFSSTHDSFAAACHRKCGLNEGSQNASCDAEESDRFVRKTVATELPGIPFLCRSSHLLWPQKCRVFPPSVQPVIRQQFLLYSNAASKEDVETAAASSSSSLEMQSKPVSSKEESNAAGAVETKASELKQSGHGWNRSDVFTWANGISMARLVSGPVLGWMIVQGLTLPALSGLVLAGASDWLDGYVARKSGVNSVLGSYLDPLADKVLIGSIASSMAFAGLLHPVLVGVVVARDAGLVVGGFVYRAVYLRWQWSGWGEFFNIGTGGAELVKPLFISKVNTVVQLVLVATALLQSAFGLADTYSAVPILSWAVIGTTSLSGIAYLKHYFPRFPTKPS